MSLSSINMVNINTPRVEGREGTRGGLWLGLESCLPRIPLEDSLLPITPSFLQVSCAWQNVMNHP